MIKNELKRSIFSRTFLLALVLMSVFAVLSAVYYIEIWSGYNPAVLEDLTGESGEILYNPDFPLFSLYGAWLGGETLSLAYTVFYMLIPIGAALPYAWSYHIERKSGYLKCVFTRIDKKQYFLAKTISVFLSGSLVILIPFVINIMMTSAYIPYYNTWAGYVFYNRVYFGTMWADIFYIDPALHMFLFVVLSAIYGGIFALLSFAVSIYMRNAAAALFLPFVITLAVGYFENVLYSRFIKTATPYELNPTRFLHSRSIQFFQNPYIILIITFALLTFALGTILIKGAKNEVY